MARIRNNIVNAKNLHGDELEKAAQGCHDEYETNIRGVRSAFNQFIFEHDGADMAQQDVEKDLVRMLNLRYKIDSPVRPPRVII